MTKLDGKDFYISVESSEFMQFEQACSNKAESVSVVFNGLRYNFIDGSWVIISTTELIAFVKYGKNIGGIVA